VGVRKLNFTNLRENSPRHQRSLFQKTHQQLKMQTTSNLVNAAAALVAAGLTAGSDADASDGASTITYCESEDDQAYPLAKTPPASPQYGVIMDDDDSDDAGAESLTSSPPAYPRSPSSSPRRRRPRRGILRREAKDHELKAACRSAILSDLRRRLTVAESSNMFLRTDLEVLRATNQEVRKTSDDYKAQVDELLTMYGQATLRSSAILNARTRRSKHFQEQAATLRAAFNASGRLNRELRDEINSAGAQVNTLHNKVHDLENVLHEQAHWKQQYLNLVTENQGLTHELDCMEKTALVWKRRHGFVRSRLANARKAYEEAEKVASEAQVDLLLERQTSRGAAMCREARKDQ